MLTAFGTIFQIGSGIFLLLFGARLIGMEYSSGTIRILYARGAGRLRVLLAKMFTLCIVAICLLAGYLLIVVAILAAMMVAQTGSLEVAQKISGEFWGDLGRWGLDQATAWGADPALRCGRRRRCSVRFRRRARLLPGRQLPEHPRDPRHPRHRPRPAVDRDQPVPLGPNLNVL